MINLLNIFLANSTLSALLFLSTFLAVNALVLWFTEPFPIIALIVLSIGNLPLSFICHISAGYRHRARFPRSGFVTFVESNAKALLTSTSPFRSCRHQKCNLTSQVLRPAGSFSACGSQCTQASIASTTPHFYFPYLF